MVCRGLLNKLPSVLMLEAEDMDVTKSLSNYALDSLATIEVRDYITIEFEANLQTSTITGTGSSYAFVLEIVVLGVLVIE